MSNFIVFILWGWIIPMIGSLIISIVGSYLMNYLQWDNDYSFEGIGHFIYIPLLNWIIVVVGGFLFIIMIFDLFGKSTNILLKKIFPAN